jgi:hypothetical protein
MFKKTFFSRGIIPTGIRYFSSKNVDSAVKDIFLLDNFQNINPALEKEIVLYSNKKQTPVSLRSLMETGKGDRLQHFDQLMKGRYGTQEGQPQASQRILIQVACFLHRELPIRLAQRATKLEASPLFMKSGKYSFFFFLQIFASISYINISFLSLLCSEYSLLYCLIFIIYFLYP